MPVIYAALNRVKVSILLVHARSRVSPSSSGAQVDRLQMPLVLLVTLTQVMKNFISCHKIRRQENRRRRIVQGSRAAGSIQGAPEPRRDAFIYRVASETTAEMMCQHISDMGVDIENTNPKAKFKSFK